MQDIPYASATGVDPGLLSLDVYPPTHGCPAPVVVWVHGGGWRAGDKSNQMAYKVPLWRDAGYTVVSVNYRLTDPAATPTVRYPTHDDDVAAAVAWVHEHIADFGGDPDRIALLGHSAGAQIVAASRPTSATSAPMRSASTRSGASAALDTEGYDVAAMASTGNPVYRAAFGDDPATWVDASPIVHVEPGKDVPAVPRRRAGHTAAPARRRGVRDPAA